MKATANKLYPIYGELELKYNYRRFEFLKLDRIDVKVASWIHLKHPKALYSFLEFIAPGYNKNGVELNIEMLYSELLKAHE